MKVLLFTGAGASVELGVPAMRPMVQDLHNHLRGQGIAEEVFGRFDARLNDVDYDVEKLIESIDGLERGEREKQDGLERGERWEKQDRGQRVRLQC